MHNLQGDVVALVDGNGNKVVEYWYDAWGKPICKTGALAETLGTLQPFRYRGCVYDEETGLYYLRSRYYCPEWGRFINADVLFRNNIYSYCNNSPVSFHDEDGLLARRHVTRVTRIVLKKLRQSAKVFSEHQTVDIGTNSAFNVIRSDVIEQYKWFASQVCDYAPWDLKREDSWKKMFPDLPRPTKDQPAEFRGLRVTSEDLGNMSYGYLGSSMGLSSRTLHVFAGAVQIYDGGYSNGMPNDLDAFDDALNTALELGKEGWFGDETRDFLFIEYGIRLYEDDQAGILRRQGY